MINYIDDMIGFYKAFQTFLHKKFLLFTRTNKSSDRIFQCLVWTAGPEDWPAGDIPRQGFRPFNHKISFSYHSKKYYIYKLHYIILKEQTFKHLKLNHMVLLIDIYLALLISTEWRLYQSIELKLKNVEKRKE